LGQTDPGLQDAQEQADEQHDREEAEVEQINKSANQQIVDLVTCRFEIR
jgi:hypothetical protein